MATNFKNKTVKEVGIQPTQIYSVDDLTRVTVIGMSITNVIESPVNIDILIEDDTSAQTFYAKSTIIPPGSSLRAVAQGEKLILEARNILLVNADIEDSIDVVLSYVEVT